MKRKLAIRVAIPQLCLLLLLGMGLAGYLIAVILQGRMWFNGGALNFP
jgi:hypothetical protein